MRFKSVALGLSLGVLWGAAVFFTTWLSYFTGYAKLFLLSVVQPIYPGYTISPLGSIIGMVYGFIDLLIMGILIGWLYNRISGQ